jgi:hypothetical protein
VKFDDLISTIDLLSDEQIDEVVDWQLAQSPAAHVEQGGGIQLLDIITHNMRLASEVHDPVQRMVDSVQEWLDTLLSLVFPMPNLPALDINMWLPGDQVNDRCPQCQRYLPDSAPDPDTSRPGYLFCDECAMFQPSGPDQ